MHALFFKFMEVTVYESKLMLFEETLSMFIFSLFLKNVDYTISLCKLAHIP